MQPSRTKKLRGCARKLRQAARAAAVSPALAAARLQQLHYDYAKLGHGPLHRFRQSGGLLPTVVRQLGAQWLLQTFLHWQQQLTTQFDEPVYCAIWLAGAYFAQDSQVVAAVRGRIGRYESVFGPEVPDGPTLPPEYHALPGANQLVWTTHRQHEWFDADDFPHGWPARLLRRKPTVQTLADGRCFLVVPCGWVWVGRLRAGVTGGGANPHPAGH